MSRQISVPLILGVGGAIALLLRGSSGGRKCPPADCSGVGPDSGTIAGVKYYEARSKGLGVNAEAPMLIVFHSLGSTASAIRNFGKGRADGAGGPLRVIAPAAPWYIGDKHSWFENSRAAQSDQDALAARMVRANKVMSDFICQIVQCRPTVGKPIVSGTSQGGMMSYLMAAHSPDQIRASVAYAGWLPRSLWKSGTAETWGSHGTRDTTVPYDDTATYWKALKHNNEPIHTTTFDIDHSVDGKVYTYLIKTVDEILGYG